VNVKIKRLLTLDGLLLGCVTYLVSAGAGMTVLFGVAGFWCVATGMDWVETRWPATDTEPSP
jgi:hypothetical protein